MRPIAVFLLSFYLLTIFVRPANALAEKFDPSNSYQLLELRDSLAEKAYTIPLSSTQSAIEIKGKPSDVNTLVLSILHFKNTEVKVNQAFTPELNTSAKIHYCWSKICINAP